MRALSDGGGSGLFTFCLAFAPRPPFELVALGRPFTLPSELRLTQAAAGMALRGETLLISYSEHDCEARLASLPLDEALADLRGAT